MTEVVFRLWDPKIDGPVTEESLRKKLENRGYSVSSYTYSPGTYFSNHKHGQSKIDAVLSGTFRMGM